MKMCLSKINTIIKSSIAVIILIMPLQLEAQKDLIVNGDFASGTIEPWELIGEGVTANASVVEGVAVIDITAVGPNPWDPQLVQKGIMIKEGTYELTFYAKSDSARTVNIYLNDGAPNYTTIDFATVNLNTRWRGYSFKFESSIIDEDAMLTFHLGNSTNNLTIDNIVLQIAGDDLPWQLIGANERIEQYRKGNLDLNFKLPDGSMLNDQVPVNFELQKHKFNFGTSLTQVWTFDDSENYDKYLNNVKDLFNFVTLGFYWVSIHKTEGNITISQSMRDNIEWAKENNITLKGHPLLWHQSNPEWLKDATDMSTLDSTIKWHIRYLLEEFPEIEEWDVFNEAVAAAFDGTEQSGITRWVEYKGGVKQAVEDLFKYVNEIAPDNKYINNHYSYKHQEFKYLNEHLLAQDAGLGGIGIQTHMHMEDEFYNESEIWNFLEEYSEYGKIQLSELTVPSSVPFKDYQELLEFEDSINVARQNGQPTPFKPSTPEWEEFQSAYYKDFYTLAFSHPAVESIVMWNVGDLNSWRGVAAGILDRDHNPKPAYHTLKQLIKEEWHTMVDGQTAVDGSMSFRGFYGSYQGTIIIDSVEFTFNFENTENNETIIIDLESGSIVGINDHDDNPIISEYKLNQNYPNPFNPETVIRYQIPEQSHVKLMIHNILGEEIVELVNETQNAGNYKVKFNPEANSNKLSSGIYFYTLEAGDIRFTKKMLYIR